MQNHENHPSTDRQHITPLLEVIKTQVEARQTFFEPTLVVSL